MSIEVAQKLGFFTVGLKVDPGDWNGPSAKEIVERVLAQVEDPDPSGAGSSSSCTISAATAADRQGTSGDHR